MLSQYLTVKGYGEHEIIIQKSRFIAYFNRATTENEAQNFIQEIKKKHWDATHNCSAYLIGENDLIQKANDDGEPSGTAGVPMLEVLKKKGLKDTVVVVTRYFGGIKLGAGGLIRAYGKAVSEGLSETGIVQLTLTRLMHTSIDYTLLGKVENEIRSSNFSIKDIQYSDSVQLDILVEEEQVEDYLNWIIELTQGKNTTKEGILMYREQQVVI
ncbi:putative YigZ family protein [Bacillus tianshenii]|uniref:YigZ family protein n=1 Tax=Sutcliffiella tianshenii TaxID=1463404 RepID=A0ABS2NUR1_9BACI|nr:YigZ family protein [Bacillus tianshenii]MBM7618379.1 putative YigZ family protein [Bacillus tianshenii]